MKNIRNIFFLFCITAHLTSISQEIQIKSVDESNYPLIKVSIESNNLNNIDFNSLYVIENKDSTTFSTDSVFNDNHEKAICFLIDEDLAIEPVRNDIISVIKDITRDMKSDDFINVLISTEKKANGKCIYPLSFEYSNDPQRFIEYLDIYFMNPKFSATSKIIDCSIEQSFEFIRDKKNIPDLRFLAILSKIPYAGGQDWQSLQKKADNYGIDFQWFSFLSKEHFFSTYGTNIQDIIKNRLDSLGSQPGSLHGKTYTLSFYTSQKDKLNQFEIDYKQVKIRSTFERSGYFIFFKDNALIISLITFIFLLIVFFIASLIYTKRQMAKSLKELSKSKHIDTGTATTKIKEKADSVKTDYGVSTIVPTLKIEIDDQTHNFELKKLITKIGRLKENDIVIDEPTISGFHATLTKEGGRFYLQDNDSTNGTFVNEIKIGKCTINTGDSVRMGKTLMTFIF